MRAIQPRCPRCQRPRGWLCSDYGRPCKRKRNPRPKKPTLSGLRQGNGYGQGRLEALRRHYLRKYGVAA
jgi:hypothetical protein